MDCQMGPRRRENGRDARSEVLATTSYQSDLSFERHD